MKKYAILPLASLLISLSILFFACKKDLSQEGTTVTVNTDLTTKVSTSVSGFVTDENDHPAQGALVTAGIGTATTDQFGYFEIKNVQLVKNAAFVTVNKTGYFKGIKTWIAADGHTAFFRIKLLPKTNSGMVSGSTGGNIVLPGGMSVSFPAAGFVNAATGAAYSGPVTVSAQWLNPTAADLDKTMPGDLRGKDASGSLKLLTTYGMAAVELTGISNELLQVAPGKKASLTMPIPASMSGTAPATIPLWYFDETNGLWKEDGSATKTGNTYVGDVSHFTYWNCDIPGPTVQVRFRLVDAGLPVALAELRIITQAAAGSAHGYTNENGEVVGTLPANSILLMQILECGVFHDVTTFTTTGADLDLGEIAIPNTVAQTAIVTGSVNDCNGLPLATGHIYTSSYNTGYYNIAPVTNGHFVYAERFCGTNLPTTIVATNISGGLSSQPFTFTLLPGNNAAGLLQTCTLLPEFLHYTVNNSSFNFNLPVDNVGQNGYSTFNVVYAAASNSNFINFNFDAAGINTGSFQDIISITCTGTDSVVIDPNSKLHITEYGLVGEHISGNFSISGHRYVNPSVPVNITCDFRTIRSY